MRRSRLPEGCFLACARTWVLLPAGYLLGFIHSLCFITGQQLFFCVFVMFFILGMDFQFFLWYPVLVAWIGSLSTSI